MIRRIAPLLLGLGVCAAPLPHDADARVVRICYTTELHGNLMPCSCPIHPLGGLARRIGWVDSLRAAHDPASLFILDAGGYLPRAKDFPNLDAERLEALMPMYRDAAQATDYDAIPGIDIQPNQARLLVRDGVRIAVVALDEGVDPSGAAAGLHGLGKFDLAIALCAGDIHFAASTAHLLGAKVAIASRGACLGGPFWQDDILILGPGLAGRYVGLARLDLRPDGTVHAIDVRLRPMDGTVNANPVWRDKVEETILETESRQPGAFVAAE